LDLLANINALEDAGELTVTLNANDVDGHAITYIATSSDTTIATVAIVNGKLVVTQIEDAFGTVNIEVNATANGLSAIQDFNLSINSVNDKPSIDTVFNDLSILEDALSFKLDINVSDIDGDDLNITIESNNTSILSVTPNWSGLINQATYEAGLDFNLTTKIDANGIVRITTIVNDGDLNTTKTFNINVTAVNDAPTVNNLSNVIVYKNSDMKSITLDVVDKENASITYSSTFDGNIISTISFTDNVMSITPVQNTVGLTDVNITLSDGDLNSSIGFEFTIIPLEDDDDLEQIGNIEQNATTIRATINDSLIVTAYDDSNGIVKHIVQVGSSITQANTDIVGAVVELISNGVQTFYDDAVNSVKVIATVLGEAIHALTVGSDVTTATFTSAGTSTVIYKNSNNDAEIISTLVRDDGNVTVIAYADGSAEHRVNVDENVSRFISEIVGMHTVENINGDVESTVGAYDDFNGYDIKAVVTTYRDGTNEVKLIKVNQSDDTDSSDFKRVNAISTPLPKGTEVYVYERDTLLYMNVRLKLDNNFIVQ